MQLPVLVTDRLAVRALTLGDGDAVRAVGVETAPRWLEWTVLSYEQLDALRQPPYGERAITVRGSGEVVGLVGLVPAYGPFGQLPDFAPDGASGFRPEIGLYWAVGPSHRGRGYATEAARAVVDHAFAALHLGRIVATTERANAASIGVMRRLGMRVEENPLPEPESLQVVGWLDRPGPSEEGAGGRGGEAAGPRRAE